MWRRVIANVVAMRAAPDARAEVVSQALFGETVQVHAQTGGWALIRTPDGYAGWVRAGSLASPISSGAPRVVSALLQPILSAPDGGQVSLLPIGSIVHEAAGDTSGEWARIEFGSSADAYISRGALADPPSKGTPIEAAALVATAKRLIGVPYLWGGRTPFGIDCSGFTQLVYGLHGTVLPRDAYQQAAWERVRPITRDEMRAGDLLFFGGDDDPRRRGITHVGMALDNGRFIHAAGGVGVTVSRVNEEPYRRLLRGCGRVQPRSLNEGVTAPA